ncbi:MAG: hypothetical protein KDA53_13265 [Hyphomonas sp.]|nr:hypothetical protein [Hyphomonas sp.]
MPFDDLIDSVVRRPSSSWAGAYAAASGLGLATVIAGILAGALAVSGQWRPALAAAAIALWLFVLARYAWRGAVAHHGWKIGIGYDTVSLDLPAARSLMAADRRVRLTLDYRDIEAIETRLEHSYSFGVGIMQRAYALRLRSGRLIRLGEDRARGSSLVDQTVGAMIDRLLHRSGLRLKELGMVEGRSGLFGPAFTHLPPWPHSGSTAPPLARMDLAHLAAGAVTLAALAGLLIR